jgi:hypothetical protein
MNGTGYSRDSKRDLGTCHLCMTTTRPPKPYSISERWNCKTYKLYMFDSETSRNSSIIAQELNDSVEDCSACGCFDRGGDATRCHVHGRRGSFLEVATPTYHSQTLRRGSYNHLLLACINSQNSFTPLLPTLPFLLLNGISVATKAGSLALQPQPTKLASTQSLIMANPAADPKAAPLADDLKEFALYVYASNR